MEMLTKVQTDQEYIVENFKKNFSNLIDEPIAIYGLGPYTQVVLEKYPEFNIVGLMDSARIGEKVFGKTVINIDQADELGVKNIIIIARASNVPIIYRRIAYICEEKQIVVFDINGRQQSFVESKDEVLKSYSDITVEKINDIITKNEVISFDVFDTLLMRDVLYPRDIFLILEKKLCEEYGGVFKDFAAKRILAEQELYLTTNPTHEEIYYVLSAEFKISVSKAMDIMNMELSIEKKHLIARKKMRDIFNELVDKDKQVCITSDMYISSEHIRQYLIDNGYKVKNVPIFVSNEYRVSKHNGLYNEVRKKYGQKSILHIGDNFEADVVAAKKYGIDNSFHIKSALQMLEDSKASELMEFNEKFENRMIIARFIARQFNDPFLFSVTGGKMIIHSCYELGFDFLAPMVMVYIKWLMKRTNELNVDGILLSSRDGYIISKILSSLRDKGIKVFDSTYFYASRNVCVLSAIENEEDIKFVASLAFSGDTLLLLKKRFRLCNTEVLRREEDETDEHYILRHKDIIIDKAAKLRERYQRYMMNAGIDKKRYAYMDFVSSGTCQHSLSRFMNSELFGLYIVKLYDSLKGGIYTDALYSDVNVYKSSLSIFDKYIFLENIFTSPEPTLVDFDQNGTPIFDSEKRSEGKLKELFEIHEGIVDGVVEMICSDNEYSYDDILLVDNFIKYLEKKYTMSEIDYFENNILEDDFCNRRFDTKVFVN